MKAWLAVDKDGTEFIVGSKPVVCLEYILDSRVYETSLYGEEAIHFNALSESEKLMYLIKELKEHPIRKKDIHEEVMNKLTNGEICKISEMSYRQNRNLRPIYLPEGTIAKLVNKKVSFLDEPVELKND